MKVKWIKSSMVGSIVVLFVLGTLLVNQIDPVFAEEIQIESELQTIQNSIDAIDEKTYNAKYLGKDLFQIKQIGKAIDAKLSNTKDSKIQAKLIDLSDKYNRAALTFLEKISVEQKNNDVPLVNKQLVEKTKVFVINIDLVTNKKLEKIVNEDFVKNEIKRLDLEDKFQKVHQKIAIEDTKYGDMKDPLIGTIIQLAGAEEYDLLDVGLQKLIKKTENYEDKKIKQNIDSTLKIVYELQLKNFEKASKDHGLEYDEKTKDELEVALKTIIDENVKDVIQYVDDAKKKSQNDYDSTVKNNSGKSSNEKSNGKSNEKSNGKSNEKSNGKSNGKGNGKNK